VGLQSILLASLVTVTDPLQVLPPWGQSFYLNDEILYEIVVTRRFNHGVKIVVCGPRLAILCQNVLASKLDKQNTVRISFVCPWYFFSPTNLLKFIKSVVKMEIL